MKTTLLILLMTGCGLWAQNPPAAESDDSAARTEILRRAVRDAIASESSNSVADVHSATNGAVLNRTLTKAATVSAAAPAGNGSAVAPAGATTVMPAASNSLTQTSQQQDIEAIRRRIAQRARQGVNPLATNAASTGPASQGGAVTPIPGIPAAPANQPPAAPGAGLPNISATPTAPLPVAAPAKPAEEIVPAGMINFPNTDINQVLDIYADLVGKTILRPTALPAQMITLKTKTPLTKTEAIEAFKSVLSMNGITIIDVPGDKFVKVLPEGQAFQAGPPFNKLSKDEIPELGEYVTHIVEVKYAKPSELVPVLQGFAKIPNSIMAVDSSGILVIRDYAENVKRMLELIDRIDVMAPLDYDEEVIPIKYALATDIASALGSLGGGSGTSIGHSAASAGGAMNGGRLGTPGMMNTPGSLGTPGMNNPGYNNTPGALGNPPGGAQRPTSFQDRLAQLVHKASASGDFQVLGQTKIIADERTNSLLIFAGKQDMEMIKNIISKLDVVLAQVLIEAAIIEVTLSDNQSLGISYMQNNPSHIGNYFSGKGAIKNGTFLNKNSFSSVATNLSSALPSGLSYFGNFGGDFQATVTALSENSRVNVLSRPTIQTSHAVPASLQIGSTVPYITGTYFNAYGGSPSSQYQQTFVGINLQVTPLINPDGLVVMDITQDVQQLGTPTTIDGNSVPTTTKRTAQAKVSVKDGDTIMLGGFISSTKTRDKSGVPILKDIPVLGYLFRSTTDSSDRTELIVLIKPTVLPNPEDAAIAANRERRRLPSVRAAEAEDDIDRAKRIKEGDRLEKERKAAQSGIRD